MTEACINSSECAMIWQLKGRYVVFQTIKAEVIIYSIHGSILLESASSSESLLFWGSIVCSFLHDDLFIYLLSYFINYIFLRE